MEYLIDHIRSLECHLKFFRVIKEISTKKGFQQKAGVGRDKDWRQAQQQGHSYNRILSSSNDLN